MDVVLYIVKVPVELLRQTFFIGLSTVVKQFVQVCTFFFYLYTCTNIHYLMLSRQTNLVNHAASSQQ